MRFFPFHSDSLFVTLLLSAYHEPIPHGLPVGIVAPAPVVRQIQGMLGTHDPGGFDLHTYRSESEARVGITDRWVDGALVVSAAGLRLLIAEAGGTGPSQALTSAFEAVAANTRQGLSVIDVIPPLPGDSEAFSPFLLMLGVLFPSVATGAASALIFRRASPSWRVAALLVVAGVVGLAVAGIADGLTGFGHFPEVAGIVAVFSLAVSAPTAVFAQIKPQRVGVAVLVFIVFSTPVSGGAGGLAPFAPGFLGAFGSVLPLGVAVARYVTPFTLAAMTPLPT